MALERKILTISNPTIPIDEMSMDNYEGQMTEGEEKDSKKRGDLYPSVEINGYKFNENEMVDFYLDCTDFLPRLTITVASTDGLFLSTSFPKDGDPLLLLIRSKKEEFKPIRMDFEILRVSGDPSTDSTGDTAAFNISATTRIPGIHTEICKSFGEVTSYDALIQAAEDLKLGFSSNDTDTADKQRWICPYDTYQKFINDTTAAAYKDDDSFYMTFIDKHYYLNLVNVNNQFSEELEVDDAIAILSQLTDYGKGKETKNTETKLILSNLSMLQSSGMYIDSYTLINSAGDIGIDNGYRREVQFYDSLFDKGVEDKYQNFKIESLTTVGAEKDKTPLKGRVGEEEFYKNHTKYKWVGTQYSKPAKTGNTHENYQYALIQNWQNNEELDKMYLHVTTAKTNFNLYRGMRIPVVMVNEGSTIRKKVTKGESLTGKDNEPLTLDQFLTGYYMIKGMTYRWNESDAVFKQDIYLSRREWPIPEQKTRS